jgi:membrane-bound metal-dependent hydrolase YbcI (DUF457 family)
MLKRNHFSWTLVISLALFYFVFDYRLLLAVLFSFFTAMISYIPDVDITISRNLKKFDNFTANLLKPITFILERLFLHRHITHTIYLPALFFIVAEFIEVGPLFKLILRIFYLALGLHILEDAMTVEGINPLYPLNTHLRLAAFSTASKTHALFLDIVAYLSFMAIFWQIL